MAKNYFTDEQVKNLGWDCSGQMSRVGDGTYKYIITLSELKALMNLAVETAIGEPVGYVHKEIPGRWLNDERKENAYTHLYQSEQALATSPAYFIKELEN